MSLGCKPNIYSNQANIMKGKMFLSSWWRVNLFIPLLVSTEVMASISSGVLDSEYSTNTSNSFRAVFTTRRNYRRGEVTRSYKKFKLS